MALESGTHLAHYEITEQIGKGGMGEVWRARDAKLDREVAIKTLPSEFAQDVDRLARFEREAKLLASLNHPNIATIHGLEEDSGTRFLVLELVEGETLADRLTRGAIPLEKSLDLAVQIAEAVESAHDKGVIHRDLKPANVKVTPKDRVKVLDFGLAKALWTDVQDQKPSQMPTASGLRTGEGQILGTPSYMSPEQVRGQAVDQRTDVWAFGCLLYEMLTGERAFRGATFGETLAGILEREPEWQALPRSAPEVLRTLLKRCLEKDMDQRLGGLREVKTELEACLAAPRGRRLDRRRMVTTGVVTVTLLVLGLSVDSLDEFLRDRLNVPAGEIRLAVLPFRNLSGDPEQEYFADGLTEEMISQIGRLQPDRLGVISRTSAMRYKTTDQAIDEIGGELGVDYILEGSARSEAGRVRITAQLIQVRDQTQLWAETFDRDLGGILNLQNEVARGVVESLALELLEGEAQLTLTRSVNPAAYEAYLKGLQHLYRLTPADLSTALQYFELALDEDPNYALAYVGIARVWGGRSQMGFVPAGEATPRRREAIQRALELDDTLAEAYSVVGGLETFAEWNWEAGEAAYRRAIDLNPSFADAHSSYSHLLSIMGRSDEALVQIERAVELDPFNPMFQAFYGIDLIFARRYDEAIRRFRTALQTSPRLPFAWNGLATTYELEGRYDEALAARKSWFEAIDESDVGEALELDTVAGGYSEALRRAADALAIRPTARETRAIMIAYMYLSGGDTDRALDWLEQGFESGNPNMPYIGLPAYDGMRSDPRFQDLLRRMNLPL